MAWLERYQHLVIIALATLLAAAVVALLIDRRGGPPPLAITIADLTPTPAGPIEVYITGAVAQPGVYEMQPGDRVIDLLSRAGGFTPDADPERVNLAQRLQDEAMVVVPRQGAPDSQVAGVVSPDAIDINTATAAELQELPGIGEVYSQRIVESRAADGPFASPDDLLQRGVIPRHTFEQIRELITAGP